MEFQKIREEIKCVNLDCLRCDCDNLFEAVVVKEKLNDVVGRLQNLFGMPVWPSNEHLPLVVERMIQGYGGIMPGQTLYFSRKSDFPIFAMLWPWQDGEHTTVKIAQVV
ncbi:MAG: hypothetical protein MUF05_07230 [Candidatus Omnitrophica bacterium]|jgi:hypothetical protein|nr:hypothetical protein [Candidatus Omnitrophota bacterium]